MTHAESRRRNAEIMAAYASGESAEALASRHKITVAYIQCIVRGTRPTAPKPGRFPTARETRMATLYRDGMTLAAIGEQFGVTRERVRQILSRRFGLSQLDGGAAFARLSRIRDKVQKKEREASSRERRVALKWGMTRDEFLAHTRQFGNTNQAGSPLQKFIIQRQRARARGIGWELTFAQWWRLWQASGKWHLRGRPGYCMARHGDSGPYAEGNVYFCTIGQNFSDSYLVDHPKRRRSERLCAEWAAA